MEAKLNKLPTELFNSLSLYSRMRRTGEKYGLI